MLREGKCKFLSNFCQYRPELFCMHASDLEVIYEDKYLLALNKPQGLVSEREPNLQYTLESVALDYLRSQTKYPEKCFIGLPHRLDRPVSGVVLLAKKKSVLKLLAEMFSKREIEKTYLAITEKQPLKKEGELANWLVKDFDKRKAVIHNREVRDSMQAILRYRILSKNDVGCLLEIKLVTGKFHQIRAQLAHIGCPIIGDVLYGSAPPYKEGSICLHARSLKFMHPVSKETLELVANPPDDERWNSFLPEIK